MFYYSFQELYKLISMYNKSHSTNIDINDLLATDHPHDYSRKDKYKYKEWFKANMPKVIFEDSNYFGIYKPPYWIVNVGNPDKSTFDVNKHRGENMLQVWLNENLKYELSENIDLGYGICNRLDVNTSGIVIVAKDIKAYNILRKKINDHEETDKHYFTIVEGKIDLSGKIATKISCISKKLSNVCFNSEKGKYALTFFNVITHLKDSDGKIYTLLDITIKTGRTHQIRVHMKMINTHIVGDPLYTENFETYSRETKLVPRICLHAYYYKFVDLSGKDVKIYCPLADDLLTAIKDKFEPAGKMSKDDILELLSNPEKHK